MPAGCEAESWWNGSDIPDTASSPRSRGPVGVAGHSPCGSSDQVFVEPERLFESEPVVLSAQPAGLRPVELSAEVPPVPYLYVPAMCGDRVLRGEMEFGRLLPPLRH